ncbi:MAG: glycoside hydrolase family 3 N-terminal domain-containing protein [Candidatus Enteromonas sp.]|nr:glycoside hydrolase family 3 N-terminal domain-containing protein [Candidatus Enteromonas sp.]
MPHILSLPPFSLSPESIKRVEETLSRFSLEEKIRSLFILLSNGSDEGAIREISDFGPSGIRYNPMGGEALHSFLSSLQSKAKIPYLVAANAEEGGNGAFLGGTYVASPAKLGSTGDPSLAYEAGKLVGKEAKSVGVNTVFAPVSDILYEFRNPVIPTRCYGSDPRRVAEFATSYLKGILEEGVIPCPKHFPGDGVDERDQHLSPSCNTFSKKRWDDSYGRVYSSLIQNGAPMVMVGHIALPSYQTENEPILPATLSADLLQGLLRGRLGFNGVIVSDATHMVGLTSFGKRRSLLPRMLNAGIDLILFANDIEEDVAFLREAVLAGELPISRIEEALLRVLGLKEAFGLLGSPQLPASFIPPAPSPLPGICASKGIVLVKEEPGVLPLSPKKAKRVLLVEESTENPFAFLYPPRPSLAQRFAALLQKEGFEVEIFASVMDQALKAPQEEARKMIGNIYNQKTPISHLTSRFDLVIHLAQIDTHNTTSRISWKMSKGTADIPWYVEEIPTILVSFKNPFHLFDAPQIKTYVNCFDANPITFRALLDKLMGREPFFGEDVFSAGALDPFTQPSRFKEERK